MYYQIEHNKDKWLTFQKFSTLKNMPDFHEPYYSLIQENNCVFIKFFWKMPSTPSAIYLCSDSLGKLASLRKQKFHSENNLCRNKSKSIFVHTETLQHSKNDYT